MALAEHYTYRSADSGLAQLREQSQEAPVTAAPFEHVADLLGDADPPVRDMTDLNQAKQAIGVYMNARIEAVSQAWPGRPAVLLSGGIDSSSVAAELAHAGANPLCVTVIAGDRDPPPGQEPICGRRRIAWR